MRFSVVTPSFRQSQWLRLCVASVADQGVEAEHLVQDACSDDGTLDWLLTDPRVKARSEKDAGMYDAINRGLRRASGDILSYLNCDEQYLPGALWAVRDYFERHPKVEILFGDCVVVDPKGEFMCYRKVQKPSKYHVMVSHLPTFTSSTFFRRSLLDRHGLFFDTQWRDVGDAAWVLRALDKGVRIGILGQFLSAFTDTGANMYRWTKGERVARGHGSGLGAQAGPGAGVETPGQPSAPGRLQAEALRLRDLYFGFRQRPRGSSRGASVFYLERAAGVALQAMTLLKTNAPRRLPIQAATTL